MCVRFRILSPFHLGTLQILIQHQKWPKTLITHARTWHFLQLSKVKFELSSLHQQSKPNLVCRHYYPWITRCVVMHCTVTCDQSWKWMKNYSFFKAWKVFMWARWRVGGRDETAGGNVMFVHALLVFFGHFWFWMGICNVPRWNGLKILIQKHMWKSLIGPLEQI